MQSKAHSKMVEVANDFYGELNDVLSKVNSWALGREKELLSLQAEHTSFLDTHNGKHVGSSPLHCIRWEHAEARHSGIWCFGRNFCTGCLGAPSRVLTRLL